MMLALDAYVFKAIYPLLSGESKLLKTGSIVFYWVLSIGLMALLFYGMSIFRQSKEGSNLTMYILGAFFVFLIPKVGIAFFHAVDDIFNLLGWGIKKVTSGGEWTRRNFITQIGLGAGAILFGGMLYGVTKGKFAWRVLRNEVPLARLPKSFDGLTIVQLSDAHLGSFVRNYEPVREMVEMVNALEPDLIVFTGDLVNEHAEEAEGWEHVFAALKAKVGKYSIFGNHDYCTRGPWSEPEREDSIARLKKVHASMGFTLLQDEHVRIERDGASIALLGVHNWGKSRHFPKLGQIDKAQIGTTPEECKVLLSHDPTHFEELIMGKEPVDLTLSGHTHGCQMGIEIPSLGIKISPVKFAYKRWGGLYQEGDQFLHVNRGMGVLAFPGRVGMAPEITLLTLKSTQA